MLSVMARNRIDAMLIPAPICADVITDDVHYVENASFDALHDA